MNKGVVLATNKCGSIGSNRKSQTKTSPFQRRNGPTRKDKGMNKGLIVVD